MAEQVHDAVDRFSGDIRRVHCPRGVRLAGEW
jgi:hypothetical protein